MYHSRSVVPLVDSQYFPLLKRGHGPLNQVKVIKKVPTRICEAEGCDGKTKHSYTSRYNAAQEWAEERGLKPGIDVRIA